MQYSDKTVQMLMHLVRQEHGAFNERIGHLATKRLQYLIPWWHEKYPTRKLQIVFIHGTNLVSIDGRDVDLDIPHMMADALRPLALAIRDVEDITYNLSRGHCADFTIEPIRPRGTLPTKKV